MWWCRYNDLLDNYKSKLKIFYLLCFCMNLHIEDSEIHNLFHIWDNVFHSDLIDNIISLYCFVFLLRHLIFIVLFIADFISHQYNNLWHNVHFLIQYFIAISSRHKSTQSILYIILFDLFLCCICCVARRQFSLQ